MGQKSGKFADANAAKSPAASSGNVAAKLSRTTIDDVLECIICLDDVENAHLCPLCSKVACLKCWDQIIPRICPNCRGNLMDSELIRCYWIADLGNCVKELRLESLQEKTRKAELENELVTLRSQLESAPGPSGGNRRPKPKITQASSSNTYFLSGTSPRSVRRFASQQDRITAFGIELATDPLRSHLVNVSAPSALNIRPTAPTWDTVMAAEDEELRSFRSRVANSPGPNGINWRPKLPPKQAGNAHNLNGTNPKAVAASRIVPQLEKTPGVKVPAASFRPQVADAPGPSGIISQPQPVARQANVSNAHNLNGTNPIPAATSRIVVPQLGKTPGVKVPAASFRSQVADAPGPSGIISQPQSVARQANVSNAHNLNGTNPIPAATSRIVVPQLGKTPGVKVPAASFRSQISDAPDPSGIISQPKPAPKQASNAHNLNGSNPIPAAASRIVPQLEKTPGVKVPATSFRSQVAGAPGPSGIISQPKLPPKQAGKAHNLNGTNTLPAAASRMVVSQPENLLLASKSLKETSNLIGTNTSDGTDLLLPAATERDIPPLMGEQHKLEKSKMKFDLTSEKVSWLNGSLTCHSFKEFSSWGTAGRGDANLFAKAVWFCDNLTLKNISLAKVIFNEIDGNELMKVRSRANPFEKVKGVFSINRSAMKMANLDAVFDFMFTNPKDMDGNNLLDDTKLLYFGDVCGGPGGFSEYILWRKKWRAKGFGITLKGENDFRLEDFIEAPCDSVEAFYGSEGSGDICVPENIESFCKHVCSVTEGGVHFTMADGGDADEGQEKTQEIQLKRLFLCQCLIALRIVRPGGHFVMKLFDLLTPFCVGLVYLMHTCFQRISIHKPNTCLPANSERYLICGFKRENEDCLGVVEYLTRMNLRLIDLTGSGNDIIHLVPRRILNAGDSEFCNYINTSNNTLGQLQVNALLDIAVYSKDPSLNDKRQDLIKRKCLNLYRIKQKPRRVPIAIDPAIILTDILGNTAKVEMGIQILHSLSVLENVYNWKYCLLGNKKGEPVSQPTLFYSQGGSKILRLQGKNEWVELPNSGTIQLPHDTFVLGVLISKFVAYLKKTEFVLHIIDAARLAGEDIKAKTFEERQQLCKIFAKAMKRPGNLVDHLPSSPLMTFRKFEKDDNGIRWNNGILPQESGVLFLPSCKHPWIEDFRLTENGPYFFNVCSKTGAPNCPNEAVCDFTYVLEEMRIWHCGNSAIQIDQLIYFICEKMISYFLNRK